MTSDRPLAPRPPTSNPRPPVRYRDLYTTPLGLFWLLSYIAFVILGWWIPNDIFVRYPETLPFADVMTELIPQVRRAGELGRAKAGDANRFYYAVMWAAMPVYGLVLAYQMNRYNRRYGIEKRISALRAAGYMLVCVIGIVAGLYLPFSGTSHASAGAWRNPMTKPLLAPFLATGPVVCVLVLLLYFRTLFNGQLLRTKTDE